MAEHNPIVFDGVMYRIDRIDHTRYVAHLVPFFPNRSHHGFDIGVFRLKDARLLTEAEKDDVLRRIGVTHPAARQRPAR